MGKPHATHATLLRACGESSSFVPVARWSRWLAFRQWSSTRDPSSARHASGGQAEACLADRLPEIGDDRKAKINPLSKNFDKKEFQELWGRINQKAA